MRKTYKTNASGQIETVVVGSLVNQAFTYKNIDYLVKGVKDLMLYGVKVNDKKTYRSTDEGDTWVETDLPVASSPQECAYAICTSGVFAIVNKTGFFSSDGITFVEVLTDIKSCLGGGIAFYGDIIVFGEYQVDDDTKRRLYKSADGGQTWVVVIDGSVGNRIRHWHSVDQFYFGRIWVATSGDEDVQVGWWKSEDWGATWTEMEFANKDQTFRTLGIHAISDGETSPNNYLVGRRLMWASDTWGSLGIYSTHYNALPYIRHHMATKNRIWGISGRGHEVLLGGLSEDPRFGFQGLLYVTEDAGETFQIDKTWEIDPTQTRGGVWGISEPSFAGNYYIILFNVKDSVGYTCVKASPTGNYEGNLRSLSKSLGKLAKQTIFNALEIRNTTSNTSSVLNIRGDVKKVVTVYNQLDQQVSVNIKCNTLVGNNVFPKTVATFTVDAGAYKVVDGADYAALDRSYEQLYMTATAAIAPTTGSISSWIINPIDSQF